MYFVIGLPKTVGGNNVIWVRLLTNKVCPFSTYESQFLHGSMAPLYVKEIVRMHGVPIFIVFNRDSHFNSSFFSLFIESVGYLDEFYCWKIY